MLAFVNTDGSVWNGPIFRGSWGIPMITYRDAGGLSLDGRTLVLQSTPIGPSTSFLVLDTHGYRVQEPVHASRHVFVRCALARRLAALSHRSRRPEPTSRATS